MVKSLAVPGRGRWPWRHSDHLQDEGEMSLWPADLTHQPVDSAPLLSDTTERETARLLFLSSTDFVFFSLRIADRASLASTESALERLPRFGNIFSSRDFSTEIAFSVCHLAIGLRGLANISDQCFSSALLELQPTSTQPGEGNMKSLEDCEPVITNWFIATNPVIVHHSQQEGHTLHTQTGQYTRRHTDLSGFWE